MTRQAFRPPMRLATSDLMERPLVLSHELANFSCKRSKDFLSLGLFRLSGAIRQLLFNSEVWWFKPAQPQLCCQVIHHSFFRVIFVSKPGSDCSDPVFGQLSNIERGEAPAAGRYGAGNDPGLCQLATNH